MRDNVNAEIISIGTEILLGELTDTNSVFIAKTLRDLGINLYYMTAVGDNESRIVDALKLAMSRAQVIITCGGLGPTIDDMTRTSIATATDRDLVFQQKLLDQIAERFAGFKVQMTENNRRQAFIPENAIIVENPVGTAPSFVVKYDKCLVIALPGVPREMKYLMQNSIIPFLRREYDLGIIKAYTLKTAGIGESSLDDLLGEKLLNSSNPSIGLAAHSGQIDIRITAKAEDEPQADQMIQSMVQQVREKADKYIFGSDEDRLEDVLMRYLHQEGLNIAVVEAGIDGGVGEYVSNHDYANSVLLNIQNYADVTVLVQSTHMETNLTKQDYCQHVAARLLSEQPSLDAVIVIISDPILGEGEDSSEGTVIVVKTRQSERRRVYGFGSRSDLARKWVSSWCMSSLWRLLREDRGV